MGEEGGGAGGGCGGWRGFGELSRFVGREGELGEGERALEEARLVTVTGPGGVGKTRLVMRLAERVKGGFPGGVHVVELAELDASMPVGQAVAAALGARVEAGREPLEAVAGVLGGRRTLLVLDNCEHVLQDVAGVVRALAGRVPEARFLASSRQALHIAGERVLVLGPLQLPRDGADSAAVELFTDRAAAVVPGFRLTDADRDAVHQVCHRLDGLPLALEIAARLLRVLTPHELLDRLGQRFQLLGEAGAERTAPARHRTLRALLDWSHDLCSADERRTWERLSLCAGTVALADAESLAAADGAESGAAFEAITGLLDKSLLGRVASGGRSRLHLLETVRVYGREKLAASGGAEEARRRHRERYLGLAVEAERAYASPRQPEWLLRLREEHANLRQAFALLSTDPDAPAIPAIPGVPGVPAVSTFPSVPGVSAVPGAPGVPAVSAVSAFPTVPSAPTASAVPGAPGTPGVPGIPGVPAITGVTGIPSVPTATTGTAGIPGIPGGPDGAAGRRDQELVMDGVLGLWLYWIVSGKPGECVLWTRGLIERRPVPPAPELRTSWGGMCWSVALSWVVQGDREGGLRLLDRLEETVPPGKRPEWLAAAVQQLRGLSALFTADHARAEAHSAQALRIGGHRPGLLTEQQALAQVGLCFSARGAHEEAVEHLLRALELSQACGETWHRSYLLWALAMEYAETGRDERAVELLLHSLELKHSLDDRLGLAMVGDALALLLARHGEPGKAALLLGACQASWRPAGTPHLWGFAQLIHARERGVDELRRALGEERFAAECLEGERLGLRHALELALPSNG